MDLDSEELRKSGIKLKLRGQAFRMLAEIAKRAGEVITYEELQSKFWRQVTVEDYKHSLGNSMLKIRKVLGDSASNPRFIETVSRGYRFLAPVEFISSVSVNGKAPTIPQPDDLALEMRQIRLQLPVALRCRDLAQLLYRCESLREQHVRHPNLHELQLLIADIKTTINHSSLLEPGWAPSNFGFETAQRVFDDPNAVSIPDPFVEGRWKTFGLVLGSVLLVVDHTGREEKGRQLVRINGARRATPGERRYYEQTRK